ncbi:uncharacterized protein ACLA_029860 [Aspergillus clavatus NRRL 1]|uniref:Uncharacterized protein n=1 Tax=Aspergillus clavatus (strain ATCC 1007 / CBS 513.65 / DSM 816 / NCTC 3887 / NRRL 1 / QM 1276 / 107) TaxID=344612 RepID=A1CRI2_ASPCL|nr:uncharacterized protein ACLA_029860 [Aspergillus clavatus NRRL 1]EAW08253.1 conserved hypothetical protein [Aspergillus clavatus NRRL 1]
MASPLGRLASQSIHITPTPQPTSLAESKLILSALQKFGEVVTFRNLKYDTTNSSTIPFRPILAIFDSPDAAKQALEASPLTVPLRSRNKASTSASASASPESDSGSSPQRDIAARGPRAIKCEIHPSRHNHQSALVRNPFYTTFRVLQGTYQFRDLVGTGIPLRELADETMARKWREPMKVKRKIARENRRLGAWSLMKLHRKGLGEMVEEEEEDGGELEDIEGDIEGGTEGDVESERVGER